MRFTIKTS